MTSTLTEQSDQIKNCVVVTGKPVVGSQVIRVAMFFYIIGQMILIFVIVLKPGAAAGLSALLQVKVTDFYSLEVSIKIPYIIT